MKLTELKSGALFKDYDGDLMLLTDETDSDGLMECASLRDGRIYTYDDEDEEEVEPFVLDELAELAEVQRKPGYYFATFAAGSGTLRLLVQVLVDGGVYSWGDDSLDSQKSYRDWSERIVDPADDLDEVGEEEAA